MKLIWHKSKQCPNKQMKKTKLSLDLRNKLFAFQNHKNLCPG